jgi:endonuclease YncB( thermonuclease family)
LIGNNISIRIRGIDAPEIRGKNNHLATKAREYLRDRIKHARSIELRNIEKDKYFRLLADVYIDNESISEVMIKEGLARQYDGGKRKEW